MLLLALQIFDNSYLIEKVRQQTKISTSQKTSLANISPLVLASHLKSKRWLNLGKTNIKHLFVLKDIHDDALIISLGYIALLNHITINDAKLARPAGAAVEQYYQEQYSRFLQGELLPNTLYVGLKNKNFYPQKYCEMLDGYVLCFVRINPV